MPATLVWATPNGDQLVGDMARVSNPKAKPGDDASKLIAFLIRNRHWSPFEMASMCVEINTTRDVGRQILRHRSFSFQEFSGRYAAYGELNSDIEIRWQDSANRQNSITAHEDDKPIVDMIREATDKLAAEALQTYNWMLELGVAKEVARRILPEGMVPTRMYMTGTIRSWIHYTHERTQPGVQKEHRDLAREIVRIMCEHFPDVSTAVDLLLVEASTL
jgi:thymidylate synthase (FAD)